MDNTNFNLQDPTNDIVNVISELADEVVDRSAGAPVQSMELPDDYPVPAPINIFEVFTFIYNSNTVIFYIFCLSIP